MNGTRTSMRSSNDAQRFVTGVSSSVEAEMPPGGHRAATAPSKKDWQVVVIVAVAVAVAAAVGDHRVIEQSAVALADALQPREQIGKLRHVKFIDRPHLPDFLRVVPVMRKLMMAFIHPEFRVAPVAGFIGEDESADARYVGLKRQDQHVAEQPQMFAVAGRDARGRGYARRRIDRWQRRGALHSQLDLADRSKIFVELLLIAGAYAGDELLRVVADEIEHALAREVASDARSGPPGWPKSRSKTIFGFTSLGSGCVEDFHETVEL